MKKFTKFLAALLCLCLLLTSCAPAEQEEADVSGDSQQVQNLEKLCLVWGYTKYHHPAFLLGQKDWDEELLNLIPTVSEAKEEEVNDILHEWFVSLGEIDYGMNASNSTLQENRLYVQADTSWIKDDTYLGKELSEDMQKLGPIPSIYRVNAPVSFTANVMGTRVPDFSNEPLYENMDYSDQGYRLLGLFRLWNAMEYNYPYLDILDDNWHDLLPKYISKMLDGDNQENYELTLASLSAKLQDSHITLYNAKYTILEAGIYGAPVEIMQAEGEIVVSNVLKDACPLQVGDVICKLDGKNIRDVLADRMEYFSVPTADKFINQIGHFLLRSNNKEMELIVLRDGTEQTIKVEGAMEYYPMLETAEQPYEILDGNIGLINPAALQAGSLSSVMSQLKSTDGLIIDLRQYPSDYIVYDLAEYLVNGTKAFLISTVPTESKPGVFVGGMQYSGRKDNSNVELYEKPVVVLMNEKTQSQAEYTIMSIRNGENVTVMGENSVGSDGDVAYLPLPGGINMMFTSQGIYTPDDSQTQRIGLTPDIEVHPTIEGIKEGRDELMEAAVAYLQEQNLSSDAAPVQDNGEAPLGSPENPIVEEPQDNGEAPLGSPENPIAEEPQDNGEASLGSPENPIAEEPQDNSEAPLGSPENPIAEEPQAE